MESQRMFRIKMIFVVITAVPFAFLVFAGLMRMKGYSGGFEDTCYALMWPVAIVGLIGGAGVAYVYTAYHAKLTIVALAKSGLQLNVQEPNQGEVGAMGKWQWYGGYTKHYAKYGMYTKELYVVLFCNDKMFCILRHKLGGFDDPPENYMEISQGVTADVPVYYTRSLFDIMGAIVAHPETQKIDTSK